MADNNEKMFPASVKGEVLECHKFTNKKGEQKYMNVVYIAGAGACNLITKQPLQEARKVVEIPIYVFGDMLIGREVK